MLPVRNNNELEKVLNENTGNNFVGLSYKKPWTKPKSQKEKVQRIDYIKIYNFSEAQMNFGDNEELV